MNRSIAKTRNQLERITLKINQLKTKYTTDNLAPHSHNGENSPTSHSHYREKEFLIKQQIPTHQIKYTQPNPISKTSVSLAPSSQEFYQKEFKIFRNEIYNYIDKCLILSKEREEEIMERAMHECMEGSRMRKGRFNLEDRIKKIEQQTTNCIGTIQDTILQTKKNEKYFTDKISQTEAKLKKEVKQLQQKILKDKPDKNQELTNKIINAEKNIQAIKDELKVKAQDNVLKKLQEALEQKLIDEENSFKKVNSRISEIKDVLEQQTLNQYNNLLGQIQKYNLFNLNLQKNIIGFKVEIDRKIKDIEEAKVKGDRQIQQKLQVSFRQQIELKMQQSMSAVHEEINQMKQIVQRQTGAIIKIVEEKSEQQNEEGNAQQAEQLANLQSAVAKNCTDIASIAQTVLDLQQKIEQMQSNAQSYKEFLASKTIESDSTIYKLRSQLDTRISQIMQNLATIKSSISSTQIQTQQISKKMFSPTKHSIELEEVKESMAIAIGQQLSNQMEANIEQVKNNVEEIRKQLESQIFIKLDRGADEREQKLMRRINEMILEEHYNLEACIKEIQNVKESVFAELTKVQAKVQQQFPRNLVRIETVDTLLEKSSICNQKRSKTSPQSELMEEEANMAVHLPMQENPNKMNTEFVDEKLNQFESDINQTIKLLYEDIENKVNDMLGHSGVMDFRADYETTKQSLIELCIKVQNLCQKSSTDTTSSGMESQIQQLRGQVFCQIGNKVEQLSNIMERTIQEVETKVQKLDGNFSYMYERLSNIEYDNANFKDKLTELLAFRAERERSNQKKKEEAKPENMLDVLGQFKMGVGSFDIDKLL